MELNTKVNQLCTELKPKTGKTATAKMVAKPQSEEKSRDAKLLEFQINQHLREKYKQQKPAKVTLETKYETMTSEELDEFMLSRTKKSKSWKAVPLYEKWKLVQEYVQDESKHLQYKDLLKRNMLNIKYDGSKITDIILI